MSMKGSLACLTLFVGLLTCGDEDYGGDGGSPNGPESWPETRPYVNDPVWPNVWTINAFDGPSSRATAPTSIPTSWRPVSCGRSPP